MTEKRLGKGNTEASRQSIQNHDNKVGNTAAQAKLKHLGADAYLKLTLPHAHNKLGYLLHRCPIEALNDSFYRWRCMLEQMVSTRAVHARLHDAGKLRPNSSNTHVQLSATATIQLRDIADDIPEPEAMAAAGVCGCL